jgi:hypothetical protein
LMSILKDDWSPLREYSLSELVDEKPADGVDAVTGATKREIAEAAVEKAVYTTHTLWHLIHVGEKEQLAKLTAQRMTQNHQMQKILSANRTKFLPFFLDMFGQGHIPQDAFTESIVLDGLTESTDPTLRTIALNALQQLDFSTPEMQDRLAVIYKAKKQPERVEILTRLKPAPGLSKQWYDAVADDLNADNPWMAVKILNTLKSSSIHSPKVMEMVETLSRSDIPVVRKAVAKFKQARFKSN